MKLYKLLQQLKKNRRNSSHTGRVSSLSSCAQSLIKPCVSNYFKAEREKKHQSLKITDTVYNNIGSEPSLRVEEKGINVNPGTVISNICDLTFLSPEKKSRYCRDPILKRQVENSYDTSKTTRPQL